MKFEMPAKYKSIFGMICKAYNPKEWVEVQRKAGLLQAAVVQLFQNQFLAPSRYVYFRFIP